MTERQTKEEMIRHIEERIMGQVLRAIKAHVRKHKSYEIDCDDLRVPTQRSFTALDEDIADFYGVEICGVRFGGSSYDLIILLVGQLGRSLPDVIQKGYWMLHIDGGDGKLSYRSNEEISGWEYVCCSTLDLFRTVDELETTKKAIDAYVLPQIMSDDEMG